MKDEDKTKKQLLTELAELRQRIAELEALEAGRKRAEEALRESEERLRRLMETVPIGISMSTPEEAVVEINPAVLGIFGYDSKEEFLKIPASAHWCDPKEREQFLELHEKGMVEDFEARYKRKDGSVIWLSVTSMGQRNEGGQTLLINVFKDITERRRAEERAKQLQEYLHLQFNRMPIGSITWDTEFRARSWNPAAKKIFGFTAEEALGKHPYHLIVPREAQPQVDDIWGRLLEGDTTAHSINENITKDGRTIICQWSNTPLKKADGTVVGVLSMVQDITERKRAEEQTKRLQEYLQLQFDRMPIGLIVWDTKFQVQSWNPAAKKMFGFTEQEALGKHPYDLIVPREAQPHVDDIWRRLLEGDRTAHSINENITKDGRTIICQWSNTPLKKADGTVVGVLSMVQDITERKRAEEALKEYSGHLEEMVEERTKELLGAQEQLLRKEKLAILGQLAGGVAHELRNPLGVISNAVYYLKTILPDADETTKEYLRMISSEVRHSEKMVSDLLDLSRTKPAEREEIAVSDLVAQVLEKRPPPEKVKVTTKIASDLPLVFVDPRQIDQVLINLVTNAYQAMPEGGRLTVKAEGEKNQVYISITDTGCGISKENMKMLFEPLFTTKAKGIGLGLAVSKNLVEANGGSIEVKSPSTSLRTGEEGKGSTFTVILPTKEVQA